MHDAPGRRAGGLRFTDARLLLGRTVALALRNTRYGPTDASARRHDALRAAKRRGRALSSREARVAEAAHVGSALAARARRGRRARLERRDLPAHALARACAPLAARGSSLVTHDT